MRKVRRTTVQTEAWIALLLYVLGHACIGFLLAMPTDTVQAARLMSVAIGEILLAWAGADAGTGAKVRSFIISVVGAYAVAGALGWAVSFVGAKASAVTATVALIWGAAWMMAHITEAHEEEASQWMMAALVLIAIIAGATNSVLVVCGIVFTFIACTSPALGEQFGQPIGSLSTFLTLLSSACIGLISGWLLRSMV